NSSAGEGRAWEGSLESSPPKWDLASGDPPGGPSNSTSAGGAAAGPQLEPPGAGTATTEPSAVPEGCPGCTGEGEASAVPPRAVTWPGDGGPVPVALGSPEEPGSGDRPTPASPPGPGGFGGLPAALPSPPGPQLATGSAESDLLLAAGGSGLGGFPGGGRGAAGSARRREPEGAATPWALHELYDDFTPFDDADFYPTTSFYADGDDEEELEDEEEDEEEEDGGLEDENGYRPPASAVPGAAPAPQEPRPTGHRAAAPPPPPGLPGVSPTAWPRPGERGPPDNGSECRSGYVRHNSSCRSLCDLVPSYCHNGGQCYLVESHGAFCRCNTQDYTWHKGTRCESIVTDFQVMCVAVGSAALVVLLLFMLTVFFAKKLYLLKTENSKLRKTKYRTPSELHNDNFSLSTIAEGSHPNVRSCVTPSPHAQGEHREQRGDDPSAPHKLQDSLKSCLKDEEPFNIHNSTSPKHEGGKGEQEAGELNCLQNNLT
uniref:Chondroitin sulfate proteoglycan 5 n=1 Tax=Catharus ustulatus TaxID=91951 RepID=A0A8C3TP01_CATUS